MVQFNAHFDGSVIKPDEPVELPIGQTLRVSIEPQPVTNQTDTDDPLAHLKALAEEYAIEGPPDLSENHDFYAHGKPRT